MLTELIGHFTYPAVFAILVVSGLGAPIPEELPIAIAAVMARWEVMHWQGALLSCVGGALGGDMLLYWVGRRFGRRILHWPTVRRVLTPAREARIVEAYRRHGLKFVVVARLVMGLRSAAFLTAGVVRVPFLWFFLVDVAAALISVPLAFGIAYAVADSVAVALARVREVQFWIAGFVVLIGAAWVIVAVRRHRRSREAPPRKEPRA
jgi:membrane protein DedA with SNARE-associated domain